MARVEYQWQLPVWHGMVHTCSSSPRKYGTSVESFLRYLDEIITGAHPCCHFSVCRPTQRVLFFSGSASTSSCCSLMYRNNKNNHTSIRCDGGRPLFE